MTKEETTKNGKKTMNKISHKKMEIFNISDTGEKEYRPVNEKTIDCRDCYECCRFFSIPLSPYEATWIEHTEKNDIVEIKKKPDGSCWYLEDGKCSIYDKRPIACREYSCINDYRIMHSDHDNRKRRNILEDDTKTMTL